MPPKKKRARRQTGKKAVKKTPKRKATGRATRGREKAASTDAAPTPATARAGIPIVGLGASAGGLEAFLEFFEKMPSDSGMAFVLATHLGANQRSLLPELLQKHTEMPVHEVTDGQRLVRNHVYVNPPGKHMAMLNGTIQFLAPRDPSGPSLPIDAFFRSLAEDLERRSIGVILSGTGSDGTLGIKAIKAAAGMVMVEDPGRAKFGGMPETAIATGLVDYVLKPSDMPERLIAYTGGPFFRAGEGTDILDGPLPEPLKKVFVVLRARTGHDFSHYKASTMRRRIERRMNVHHIRATHDYVRYLQDNPTEADVLFRELLIGVTSFFRDPEAFDALVGGALSRLVESKQDDAILRAWVPGCSSGEEAYSAAIAIRECLDARRKCCDVQVFGTDLDAQAIEMARDGLYPDGISADLTPKRLRRFFAREDGFYRIKKEIRDSLIFAQQSVIKDPPFTKLDLICCRNVLIYLDAELQRRLLPLFHYALNPDGILFLGSSETIGGFSDLFCPCDKKWKIFTRRDVPTTVRAAASFARPPIFDAPHVSDEPVAERAPAPVGSTQLMDRLLLARFAPASVIINEAGQIAYIHGRTGQYLEPSPGQPSNNIHDMAREGLRLELTTAVRKAIAQDGEVVIKDVRVKANGEHITVNLTVRRIREPETLRGLLLITFEEGTSEGKRPRTRRPAAGPSKKLRGKTVALEQELQHMKESYQHTVEELKSTNEELQSTNEELQSTNEELETSKEEMHSLNEELQTVNAELHKKLEDLEAAGNDMKNLLDSTEIATIFLDGELRIKRFTASARDLVKLIESDRGRPIADLASNLEYDGLVEDAKQVLRTLTRSQTEVQAKNGAWYRMQMTPYRTMNNVIDGLVITFVDVSALKAAEAASAEAARQSAAARDLAEGVVDTVRDALLVLDVDLRVIRASRSFYGRFEASPEQTEGRPLYDLGDRQWDIPELRTLLEEILPKRTVMEGYEVEHDFPGVGRRKLVLNARRVVGGGDRQAMILLSITDAPG